jgi:hypothetical protein
MRPGCGVLRIFTDFMKPRRECPSPGCWYIPILGCWYIPIECLCTCCVVYVGTFVVAVFARPTSPALSAAMYALVCFVSLYDPPPVAVWMDKFSCVLFPFMALRPMVVWSGIWFASLDFAPVGEMVLRLYFF